MTAVSFATILYLVLLISGAGEQSKVIRWLGGASFLMMIADIVFFVFGVKDFSETSYGTLSRVLAVLVPGLAAAIFILVYMTGILVG